VWLVVLAAVVVVAVVVAVVLATRGDDGTPAASSSPTTSAAASPSTTPTRTTNPTVTPTAAAGCAPNDASAPAGADVHEVVDVDGDGRPDQAWLSGGAERRFGITTASGATFSAAVESASPVPASAVVQRVQADELPIALVDLGREALLYSLEGCAVTAVQNAQGQQYRFDRGFAGEGTGVGCSQDGGVLRLAGLNAEEQADGTWTVTRTWVDLSADGRRATNGTSSTFTAASAGDPVVATAQEVTCGDLVAGTDGPVEPQ
jgi:hypothetical protein